MASASGKNMSSGARLIVQIPALVVQSPRTSLSLSSVMSETGVISPTSARKSLRMLSTQVVIQPRCFDLVNAADLLTQDRVNCTHMHSALTDLRSMRKRVINEF